MANLSLDSLTLTDTEPVDLIRAAATAGFDMVTLWVQAPPLYSRALLTPAKEAECLAVLRDTGLRVPSLEGFDLGAVASLDSFRPALELGARLGGTTALAIDFSSVSQVATADTLARFAEIAAEYGLGVNLEPVAGGRTATMVQGEELIRASGADIGLLFDVWHSMRSGGGLADLARIDMSRIRHVQVNDGLLVIPPEQLFPEAIGERPYPGAGEFPLADYLSALPKDLPIGIESPSLRRSQAGLSPLAQACEAMASMHRVLAEYIGR
jgi:sugar phosphate isomerase/epimerase